jgi:hypothetical protein
MIDNIWFYNVYAGQRPPWVDDHVRSFLSANDAGIRMLDITNGLPAPRCEAKDSISWPKIAMRPEKYRQTMFLFSLCKFHDILSMETNAGGYSLVLDSDLICLRPLSEWNAFLLRAKHDIRAPLVFLHREIDKWWKTNSLVPPAAESLCSGNIYHGVTGNMGAVLLNTSSGSWAEFRNEYLKLLNKAIESPSSDKAWRDDVGIITRIMFPLNPAWFDLLEMGTIEKVAKTGLYGKKPADSTNKCFFFHVEGAKRKTPEYFARILRRSKSVHNIHTKLATWASESKYYGKCK